ncbi:hypothetical protein X275_08200 [Marinitoga sp. 1197]|uniref:hypothetical protein n=1 Tax=Marinitoga sp. 1197 TaxID=1428449 RepID=UPI00064110AB|nr:hypothetical protein [Marinitoga sp. 1197]KLO21863.1 hypothetical protein X275_08200 [Marinitoga sp. 1197]
MELIIDVILPEMNSVANVYAATNNIYLKLDAEFRRKGWILKGFNMLDVRDYDNGLKIMYSLGLSPTPKAKELNIKKGDIFQTSTNVNLAAKWVFAILVTIFVGTFAVEAITIRVIDVIAKNADELKLVGKSTGASILIGSLGIFLMGFIIFKILRG